MSLKLPSMFEKQLLNWYKTPNMTTSQVVEMSFIVNNNSPIQDCVHPDDHTQPTYETTPGFKPFTVFYML